MKTEEVRTRIEGLAARLRDKARQEGLDGASGVDAEALEEVLDILQDYEGLARQSREVHEQFYAEGRPTRENGLWLCPGCGRKVQYRHAYCHWCGKRMGWAR